MKRLMSSLAAALLLLPAVAFCQEDEKPKPAADSPAAPPQPDRPPGAPPGRAPVGFLLIQALDADGDGVITKEDIEGAAEALKKLDKNEDGKLTRDEYFGPFPFPGGPDGPRPGPDGAEQFIRNMLNSADKDKDGKLSKDEAIGPLRENFDTFDENKDGLIDADELKAMPRRLASSRQPADIGQQFLARLLEADADKDGKLSKEEAPGRVKENFDSLDGNKDGFLDKEELTAMARRFGGGRAPGDLAQQMVARLLESADKDKDGKLSKEEAPDRMKDAFDQLDANKDGFVDKDELAAMAARLGSVRPGGQGPPGARPDGDANRPAPEPESKPEESKPEGDN